MYCFDTNIIIDILRGDVSLGSKLEKMKGISDVFITTISLCELYRGAYGHSNREEKIRLLNQLVSNFNLLSLEQESCEEFGRSYKILEEKGSTTKDFDLMIASIVKSNGFVLVTRDRKHFENLGVKIEVW